MGRGSREAAFLDRDRTLNVRPPEHAHTTSSNDFAWLPGAVEGAARLARAGYVLAVVSNQRGVARGLTDVATLYATEAVMQPGLADRGRAIEAFAYCTHHEHERCGCCKPQPGLILRLAREFDVNLRRSWMIGDSERRHPGHGARSSTRAAAARARTFLVLYGEVLVDEPLARSSSFIERKAPSPRSSSTRRGPRRERA
jgi:histidinol-phosphate phosphatase family protein